MDTGFETRPPVVAGQFYPSDPTRLREDISDYLSRVDIDRGGLDIVALVVPHAGYIYSGPVAAFAYRQVAGKDYDLVAVIAPSHRQGFGFSSVFGGRCYETPLGEVPVDREVAGELELAGNGQLRVSSEGHTRGGEHSLEVQLPFLQMVIGSFRLVPVVMGSQGRESALALSDALVKVLRGRRALLVASTDLSHYHDQERAELLDRRIVERLNAFDPEGLLEDICSRRAEACGAAPAFAVMSAARALGATGGENLCYMTSAARSGDFSHVVGYAAGIFHRQPELPGAGA